MGIFQGIFQPEPLPYFIPLKTSSETDKPTNQLFLSSPPSSGGDGICNGFPAKLSHV